MESEPAKLVMSVYSVREAMSYNYDHGEDEERYERYKDFKNLLIDIVFTIVVIAITVMIFITKANAETIPTELATKALVGEAGGQSDRELYAHACALRNRGTLKGVYGLNAPHVAKESAQAFKRARNAWFKASNGPDIVFGRTEWRSEYDLAKIKRWAPNKQIRHMSDLTQPLKIGDTTFYYRKDRYEKKNS